MHIAATRDHALIFPEEEIPVLNCDGLSRESSSLAERFSSMLIEVRPTLSAYLRTILRDSGAIEDCLQEASVTIWQHFQQNWDLEDFRRYSFTCARFKALSWLKKNKPSTVVFLNPEVAEQISELIISTSLEQESPTETRLRALERCIESMPKTQQRILQARYSQGSSEDLSKVAKQLSRSMNSVYKQLERLRTALKKCMETKLDQEIE